MTTDNPNEGNPQPGSEGQPNQPLQDGTSQPLGKSLDTLQKQIEDLTKQFRGIQSEKDRTAKKVDDITLQIGRIVQLKDEGKDEAEIRRELLLDKLLAGEVLSQNLPVGAGLSQVTNVPETQIDIATELKQLDLDVADNDVVDLVKKQYRNPDHFRAEAAKLALSKAKTTLPSDTTSIPPSGVPVVKGTKEELEAAYQKEIKAVRGDVRAISNIQAKYRKVGLSH